jgi:predicted regulator of Ras-like GTPase activity (Roadblock/LC7/MglB family)
VIEQQGKFDWMLRDLYDGVPGIEMIVVLSAAACAGLQSLAGAVAQEIPTSDGEMKMVIIEMNGGYFYLMAAGPNAFLAVLSDVRCEPGRMSLSMADLVARIGPHLTSPARRNGQTV